MISNVSIQEYARLAHLFRKALDESYAESKLKNYPIFSLFPQGTCGDCSCLLSRFIVEHNLPEPTYIAGERADGSTHAWLEIHDTIIDITHDQFGTPPAVYIGNYDIPNTYLGFKIKNRISLPMRNTTITTPILKKSTQLSNSIFQNNFRTLP